MDLIREKTEELAELLKSSSEYREYAEAAETAYQNASAKALLDDYSQLRLKVQAAELSGTPCDELLQRLQKLGELLQMDPATSEYLLAQYRLNNLLADIYKLLAKAVGADLSPLD